MNVDYRIATPDLQHRLKVRSGTNAADFIRFDDDSYALIAVVDEEPVALIAARAKDLSKPFQDECEAFIDIIEVQPDYQRQGIGTTLTAEVIAWAEARGALQVGAWSEEIRYEALMLWKKLGFSFSQVDFERNGEKRYGFYVCKRL